MSNGKLAGWHQDGCGVIEVVSAEDRNVEAIAKLHRLIDGGRSIAVGADDGQVAGRSAARQGSNSIR